MNHDYLISYIAHEPGGIAYGAVGMAFPRPIASVEDVEKITATLRANGIANPTVMAFSRFDNGRQAS